MESGYSLKDQLFNRGKVEQLAYEIQAVYPAFDAVAFIHEVVEKLPPLELKARIGWIAQCLRCYLPDDYPEALGIIVCALPSPNDPTLTDNDFGDFIYAPYGEFVARYGCESRYLDLSLAALYEITKRFSAEDAIRYFINAFPRQTMKELLVWSTDQNYHVRRLSSEGTRPKLPWSQKITISQTDALPILENLFADKTRYVTRSVANHLNDIAKTNPQLVIDTLTHWRASQKQSEREMNFIIRHSLRTLIKLGHPGALKLFGIEVATALAYVNLRILSEEVAIGSSLEFELTLASPKDTPLLVDYIITFQNARGELKSAKVFKLKQTMLPANQAVTIAKKHPLRPMTTRTLYPGLHRLDIQANGVIVASESFILL